MIEKMRSGAVVIDLAVSQEGTAKEQNQMKLLSKMG